MLEFTSCFHLKRVFLYHFERSNAICVQCFFIIISAVGLDNFQNFSSLLGSLSYGVYNCQFGSIYARKSKIIKTTEKRYNL
jgi:hypothetical protein